jgi:hypothetical protein
MKKRQTTTSKCICHVCKAPITEFKRGRAGVCNECAQAVRVAEIMDAAGFEMDDAHYALALAAIKELNNDPAAFRVIRRFVALLNTQVAFSLFVQPAAEIADMPALVKPIHQVPA